MKKYSTLFLIVLTAALSTMIGCNRNIGVYGKIEFPDKKPLAKGIVCFQGDKFVSRGTIQSDGSYRLATIKPNDGILPGEYKVFITGAVTAEKIKNVKYDPDGASPEGKIIPLIDSKMMNPDTSGIVCEVNSKMKLPFDITVEYPK